MTSWLWIAWTAAAADPTCPDQGGWLDGDAHLRALSLDLRGVVPDPDVDALVDGEVPESLVDEWLASEAFGARAVRFHRSLLWNNVTNQRALANSSVLGTRGGIYYLRVRSDDYRGVFGAHCGDFPASFDAQGDPVPLDAGDGTVQEGWVWVTPYWDPDNPVKVCAFDAQQAVTSPLGNDCRTQAAFTDPACGCGPDLRWCGRSVDDQLVMESFGEEVDRRVRAVVLENRSYTELLTGQTGFVNGPIVDFLRHRTQVPGGVRFVEAAVDPAALPELGFDEVDTWVEIDLGPEHAGVLTSPAYLLRFQTGRARADRFYNAFLCQPFQPPEGGLPDLDDPNPSLDLTARDGCKYCHALLEPAAAHWGRWTPRGGGYLDPLDFPAYDERCAQCAQGQIDCPEACNRFYVTRSLSPEEDPYLGWLTAYAFLEPRHEPHVELGPRRLVDQGLVDGRVATCAAEQAVQWLVGRAPESAADREWVDELARDFVASGYQWRRLVKDIVLSSQYRSVP